MSARRALALAPLLAVVAAAGCGGSTSSAPQTSTTSPARTQQLAKRAYVLRMQELGRRLGKEIQSVYPIDTGTAHSQISKQTMRKLQRARVVVQGLLAQLQTISPPAAVAADHREVERGVKGIDTEMYAVILALRDGDLAASIEPAALPSLQTVTNAIDRMEQKGYDVLAWAGPNG